MSDAAALLPAQDQPEASPAGSPIYRYEGGEPAPLQSAGGNDYPPTAIEAHIGLLTDLRRGS